MRLARDSGIKAGLRIVVRVAGMASSAMAEGG